MRSQASYVATLTQTAAFAFARLLPASVHESPTYLVATDQLDDACSAIEGISTANGEDSELYTEDMRAAHGRSPSAQDDAQEQDAMLGAGAEAHPDEASTRWSAILARYVPAAVAERLHDLGQRAAPLFRAPHRRAVVLTWLLWALISLAFTMFNAFYPMYLQRKLGEHQAPEAGSSETKALYDYLWYAVSSVPGSLLGAALIESPLGRAKSLALALLATAGAQLLFLAAEDAASVEFSGMGVSLAATTAYAILYGYTPNVFPTSIRGTACAIASALGRITGIAAPLLAGALLQVRVELAVMTSVALFALCACTALLLPSGTRAAVQL